MSSVLAATYFGLVLAALFFFAFYDINTRTIPNLFLICFIPLAAFSPFVYLMEGRSPLSVILNPILGFLIGGLVLLAPAMLSKGGIGGGDIKLAAMLGFIFGPGGILFILLLSTVTALVVAAIKRGVTKKKVASLAFVPFYFIGASVFLVLNYI